MDYKTILVHLDAGRRRSERLEIALALADRCDAHVVGLFALSAARVPSYVRVETSAILEAAQEQRRGEAAGAAEAEFRSAAARYGGAKAEWRASRADAQHAVQLNARYSDLVIVGQRDRDTEPEAGVAPEFVDELVLSCGRPVLLVPYAGRFRDVGRRVLVAWNASAEAARAVADALPLLERAERVDVIVFESGPRTDHGEEPGADAALYLARHGVKATVSRYGIPDVDVGSQILTRAADLSVDLIVMGAYGHSRLRELVLGGATRTILESMTVPVLMSR
ncbi:MAG TPA: universal stress protein [Burkholderiales bacterium]|nr:universal stress protein [Burkholderiales bacterium]